MTSRMDCVLTGTSLRRMTLTGRVVWDSHRPTTQVLPLETAVVVSLVNSLKKFSRLQKRVILVSPCHSLITFYNGFKLHVNRKITGKTKMIP